MVHMDARQLFSNCLNQQCSNNRRVNAAGKSKQNLLVADLLPQSNQLFVYKSLGQFRCGDTLHGIRTSVILHIKSSFQ